MAHWRKAFLASFPLLFQLKLRIQNNPCVLEKNGRLKTAPPIGEPTFEAKEPTSKSIPFGQSEDMGSPELCSIQMFLMRKLQTSSLWKVGEPRGKGTWHSCSNFKISLSKHTKFEFSVLRTFGNCQFIAIKKLDTFKMTRLETLGELLQSLI